MYCKNSITCNWIMVVWVRVMVGEGVGEGYGCVGEV